MITFKNECPCKNCVYYIIRKLTHRECFRLMSFGDDDFEKCRAAGMSDCQLYKQAGNSIVVSVLEKILKELF
nr:MAG TPA: Cytosine specific methyltransferase [Caudoviricetes sp.]